MKHILLTTITAVLVVGCGEPQQSVPHPETKPEPTTSKAADISIHEAVAEGNIEAVRQHLAAGTDVGAKNAGGETILNQAVFCGRKAIVKLLIEKGANVNEKDNSGETPLHLAAHLDHKEIVELLIIKGADVNAKTTSEFFGETPLDKAGAASEIVNLLRKHGGKSAAQLEDKRK